MLPFIWNDALFHDGIASSLPSMGAYVVASVYMYRTGWLVTASRAGGWIAASVILLNPSLLYIQSTAMSETLSLCAFIVAVYYAFRLVRTASAMDIAKCAAAAAAGTLIRYENWLIAVALLPVVAYAAWRIRGYRMLEAWSILYAVLAFAGCAAWVLYNLVIFGDPLAPFFYGNPTHTFYPGAIDLPIRHHPLLALETYAFGVAGTVGWAVLVLAAIGFVAFAWQRRVRIRALPAYLTLVPLAFYWVVLTLGFNTETMPELGTGTYYQVRFALLLLPAVALFLAYLVAITSRAVARRLLVVGALAAVAASSAAGTFAQSPFVLREALPGGALAADRIAGQTEAAWLSAHYHGGRVLVTYINLAPTIFYLLTAHGFSSAALVTDSDSGAFASALEHPQTDVTWIVMNTAPSDGQNMIWLALHDRTDWRRHFVLRAAFVQSAGTTEMFQLREAR
jgi:hypothetical protein